MARVITENRLRVDDETSVEKMIAGMAEEMLREAMAKLEPLIKPHELDIHLTFALCRPQKEQKDGKE